MQMRLFIHVFRILFAIIHSNTYLEKGLLQKPFEEYTVTEGYLLLFLVLGFCMLVWKLVKGVF